MNATRETRSNAPSPSSCKTSPTKSEDRLNSQSANESSRIVTLTSISTLPLYRQTPHKRCLHKHCLRNPPLCKRSLYKHSPHKDLQLSIVNSKANMPPLEIALTLHYRCCRSNCHADNRVATMTSPNLTCRAHGLQRRRDWTLSYRLDECRECWHVACNECLFLQVEGGDSEDAGVEM